MRLPDIIGVLEELPGGSELVWQAIELEAKTADRGLTLESLARDSLKELQARRGAVDANVEADFGGPAVSEGEVVPDAAADFLKEIQEIQKRNTSGGNRRIV